MSASQVTVNPQQDAQKAESRARPSCGGCPPSESRFTPLRDEWQHLPRLPGVAGGCLAQRWWSEQSAWTSQPPAPPRLPRGLRWRACAPRGCPYLCCELDGLGQGELWGPGGLAGRLWWRQVASPGGGWGLRGRGGGGGGGRGGSGGRGGQELGLRLLQEELLLSWHQRRELWAGRGQRGPEEGHGGSRESRQGLAPEPSGLGGGSSRRTEEGKRQALREWPRPWPGRDTPGHQSCNRREGAGLSLPPCTPSTYPG